MLSMYLLTLAVLIRIGDVTFGLDLPILPLLRKARNTESLDDYNNGISENVRGDECVYPFMVKNDVLPDLGPEPVAEKVDRHSYRKDNYRVEDSGVERRPEYLNKAKKVKCKEDCITSGHNEIETAVVNSTTLDIEWLCKASLEHRCPKLVYYIRCKQEAYQCDNYAKQVKLRMVYLRGRRSTEPNAHRDYRKMIGILELLMSLSETSHSNEALNLTLHRGLSGSESRASYKTCWQSHSGWETPPLRALLLSFSDHSL